MSSWSLPEFLLIQSLPTGQKAVLPLLPWGYKCLFRPQTCPRLHGTLMRTAPALTLVNHCAVIFGGSQESGECHRTGSLLPPPQAGSFTTISGPNCRSVWMGLSSSMSPIPLMNSEVSFYSSSFSSQQTSCCLRVELSVLSLYPRVHSVRCMCGGGGGVGCWVGWGSLGLQAASPDTRSVFSGSSLSLLMQRPASRACYPSPASQTMSTVDGVSFH